MRTLVSLNPYYELRRLAQMLDRDNGDTERQGGDFMSSFSVPVDIWEKDGKIMVKASVPGMDPEEIDVSIEDGVLTIQGEVMNEDESDDQRVYHREVRYGRFMRSISLPEDVDEDNVDAEFRNGFVMISIPRKEPSKAERKRLNIRHGENKPKQIETRTEGARSENEARDGKQSKSDRKGKAKAM
jgi:HSP20 family protein